jgi:hypothetical protein
MSKLDELYKQKEAILKELNKLPNKERDYKEYYKIQNKIHYWTNEAYRKNKNKCDLQRYHNKNNLNVKTII